MFSIIIAFISLLGMDSPATAEASPVEPPAVPVQQMEVNKIEVTEEGALARCLTSSGAVLYGSYTCPHCIHQKELFGDAVQYINYVECNSGAENADREACIAADITAFPTWVLGDGEKLIGTRQLDNLAEATGC